jgi:transposase InsO family protein
VGPLLASPPPRGALQEELERLSKTSWKHPTTGELVQFSIPTIERWYYAARGSEDPMAVLRRKPRRDRGRRWAVGVKLAAALRRQHRDHPSWSYQLHLDNLAAQVRQDPDLGPMPSYASLRRYMMASGLERKRRRKGRQLREGELRAHEHHESREKRSFEAEYVNGLWHLDFHHGSRKILTAAGQWVRPILLAVLDDHSRLVCHAQWYLQETAESLVHGLIQAFCKRGLPRALMTDNGSAMLATETTQGLGRLSILHQTTLPYSPHQNGKQEVFWAQVEGRLLAMLEGEPELTLSLLNTATLAWVEMEYQHRIHSETGQKPLDRWLDGPSARRECPSVDDLRLAFTMSQVRTQRRSDGTISIAGRRFEVPARFAHLRKVQIRYAGWDLSHVWLMDEDAGVVLERLFPLDKVRNAEGIRRPIETPPSDDTRPDSGIAPLLRQLMSDYAATGLPPAYIPQEES